jgi:hypothetical protein
MENAMANTLWGMVSWVFNNLPWLFIAMAAVMALSKRRRSIPLLLQVIGAVGLFFAASIIFGFLWIVALLIFAAGFCWEKFSQWREPPASAQAFPVT